MVSFECRSNSHRPQTDSSTNDSQHHERSQLPGMYMCVVVVPTETGKRQKQIENSKCVRNSFPLTVFASVHMAPHTNPLSSSSILCCEIPGVTFCCPVSQVGVESQNLRQVWMFSAFRVLFRSRFKKTSAEPLKPNECFHIAVSEAVSPNLLGSGEFMVPLWCAQGSPSVVRIAGVHDRMRDFELYAGQARSSPGTYS